MNCPFCGEEMREGAIQTKDVRTATTWTYRWVPPAEEEAPAEALAEGAPPLVKDLLGKAPPSAQALAGKAEDLWQRWRRRDWDTDQAVPLSPEAAERRARELLVTGDVFFLNAWYCPQCEKALCVFSREKDEPRSPYLDEDGGDEEQREAPPEQKPEPPPPPPPPPKRRSKPRDDPWEQKGLFGRRKKPDWEK